MPSFQDEILKQFGQGVTDIEGERTRQKREPLAAPGIKPSKTDPSDWLSESFTTGVEEIERARSERIPTTATAERAEMFSIERPKRAPKGVKELTFREKWKEIKEEGPAQFVGFVSGGIEAAKAAKVAKTAWRLDRGEATEKERGELLEFAKEQRAKQYTTPGYKILDVVAGMPAFMQEFILTGPAYRAGQKAAMKGITKGLEKYTGKIGAQILEKQVGKVGMKVAAGVAGATLQTPFMGAPRIVSGTIERSMPKLRLSETERGDLEVLIAGKGEDFVPAFLKSVGDQWAETVSEHSGGLFAIMGRGAKNAAIKSGLLSSFIKANPNKSPNAVIGTFRKMGYHGVLNEMMEERLGEVLRAGIGVQDYSLPTLEQLGVEMVAFAVPGVVQSMGARAFDKMKAPDKVKKSVLGGITSTYDKDKSSEKFISSVMEGYKGQLLDDADLDKLSKQYPELKEGLATAKDYARKEIVKDGLSAAIDEGLSTGEFQGEEFTPEDAMDFIGNGLTNDIFTTEDLEDFKEKHPELKTELNSLMADNVAADMGLGDLIEEPTPLAVPERESAELERVYEKAKKRSEKRQILEKKKKAKEVPKKVAPKVELSAGKIPWTTKERAERALEYGKRFKAAGFTGETHEIVPVEGGFGIAKKTVKPEVKPEVKKEPAELEEGETLTGRDEKYGIDVELKKDEKGYTLNESDENIPEYKFTITMAGINKRGVDLSGKKTNFILNSEGDFIPAEQIKQIGSGDSSVVPYKPEPKDRDAVLSLVAKIEFERSQGHKEEAARLESQLSKIITGISVSEVLGKKEVKPEIKEKTPEAVIPPTGTFTEQLDAMPIGREVKIPALPDAPSMEGTWTHFKDMDGEILWKNFRTGALRSSADMEVVREHFGIPEEVEKPEAPKKVAEGKQLHEMKAIDIHKDADVLMSEDMRDLHDHKARVKGFEKAGGSFVEGYIKKLAGVAEKTNPDLAMTAYNVLTLYKDGKITEASLEAEKVLGELHKTEKESFTLDKIAEIHKQAVKDALVEGKTVSKEILEGYPDLVEKPKKVEPKKEEPKEERLYLMSVTGKKYADLSIGETSRQAFGFAEEDIKTIKPQKLNVKYRDDFENVIYAQEKSGLSKKEWAKTIDLSNPIQLSFKNGKFYIEDGHHRYYAAKILNKELKVDSVDIKDKPHETAIRQALRSGKLTPEKYAELHEKDYGPLTEFMPEVIKKPKKKKPEKESWEMPKDKWVDGHIKSPAMHREHVKRAVAEGKAVPEEVLREYPTLVKVKAKEGGVRLTAEQEWRLGESARGILKRAEGAGLKDSQEALDLANAIADMEGKKLSAEHMAEATLVLAVEGRAEKGWFAKGADALKAMIASKKSDKATKNRAKKILKKLTPEAEIKEDAIVMRALKDNVVDIGQLSETEIKALNKAVKDGVLEKAKAGKYPGVRKNVYAKPGFDFEGQRREALEKLKKSIPKKERRKDVVLRKKIDELSPEEKEFTIAELRRMNEEQRERIVKLRDIAHRDPLTGLLNRRGLKKKTGRKKPHHVFMDLIGFKNINDTVSHEAGDVVLRAIAKGMKAIDVKNATRWGGDELVFQADSIEMGEAKAQELRDYFKENPIKVTNEKGEKYRVTVMFRHGVARTVAEADTLAEEKRSVEPKEWGRGEKHPGLEKIGAVKRTEDVAKDVWDITKKERRWIVDSKTKKVLKEAIGAIDRVDLSVPLDKEIIDIHTHPDEAMPSDYDWGRLGWSNVKEMRVVTPSGTVYELSKPAKFKKTPRELRERHNVIENEIFDSGRSKDMSVDEILEAINEQLAEETGIIIKKKTLEDYRGELWLPEIKPAEEPAKGDILFAEKGGLADARHTVESLKSELSERIGRDALDALVKTKKVNLIAIDEAVDLTGRPDLKESGIQGFYSNGIVYLLPENIDKGHGFNVLMHELGVHYGYNKIFGKKLAKEVFNAFTLKRYGDDKLGKAIAKAFDRVPEKTPVHFRSEEAVAYFCEEHANIDLALHRKIIARMRLWAVKHLGIKPDIFAHDDYVALAASAMRGEAKKAAREPARKEVSREIFYSKEAVKDVASGTWYHGTPADRLDFGKQRTGNQLPFGVHFTRDKAIAESFKTGEARVKPTEREGQLIHAKIEAKNPLDIRLGIYREGTTEFKILKEIASQSRIENIVFEYEGKNVIDPNAIFWKKGRQADILAIKKILKKYGYDNAILYAMKTTRDPLGVGAPVYIDALAVLDENLVRQFEPAVTDIRYSAKEKKDLHTWADNLIRSAKESGEPLVGIEAAKAPVTADDYTSNRETNKKVKLAAVSNIKKVATEIVEGVDKYLGSISTRLGQISPKLKDKLRRLDFDINTKYAKDVKLAEPLLIKAKKMSKEDFADWDYARKNSDIAKINELVSKYGMQKEYGAYREVLARLRMEGTDVGMDIGEIEEYAPRILKDTSGFLTAIGKDPEWPLYSRLLQERANELGISVAEMPADIKADIISNTILGGWSGLSGVPATKQRKLEKIPPELNPFYLDSDAALMQHLHSMRNGIEARKFFGKIPKKVAKMRTRLLAAQSKIREMNEQLRAELTEEETAKLEKRRNRYMGLEKAYTAYIARYATQRDYTQNIGSYVMELIESKEISPHQEQTVNDILMARFHEAGTRGLVQDYKNLSYIDTMGSPISALTQIGDLAWAAYEGGLIRGIPRTLKYAGRALIGKARITRKDVGVERIAQEFADSGMLGNAVTRVFKIVGLEKIDAIGKESLMAAALDKYQREAKKNPEELKKKIRSMFEGETDSVIEDLLTNEISDNVKLLVYSRLLDFQPVGLSEMPQKYLDAGNGRLFYMLKTFTLKVFDAFRNEAYYKIKTGNRGEKIQGMTNLATLAFFFVLANVGADELKDWVLGRKTEFSDRMIDNALRLFGVSKFVTWKARTEGVGSALARQVLPPFKFIDSLGKDIITAGDEKGLEMLGSVPVIGKLAYWHIGRGVGKREDLWERRLRKRKAKLSKIEESFGKAKDKKAYRREHWKELKEFQAVKSLQSSLNKGRIKVNKLKSKEETPERKRAIQRLEKERTEQIRDFLKSIDRTERVADSIWSGVLGTAAEMDATQTEINRLVESGALVQSGKPSRNINAGYGVEVKLNDDQYSRYVADTSAIIKLAMDRLVARSAWQKWSDKKKAFAVKRVINKGRKIVRDRLKKTILKARLKRR